MEPLLPADTPHCWVGLVRSQLRCQVCPFITQHSAHVCFSLMYFFNLLACRAPFMLTFHWELGVSKKGVSAARACCRGSQAAGWGRSRRWWGCDGPCRGRVSAKGLGLSLHFVPICSNLLWPLVASSLMRAGHRSCAGSSPSSREDVHRQFCKHWFLWGTNSRGG